MRMYVAEFEKQKTRICIIKSNNILLCMDTINHRR